MSEAMNEVYRSGDLPSALAEFLHAEAKPKSVSERSREALRRIFEAVDAASDGDKKSK